MMISWIVIRIINPLFNSKTKTCQLDIRISLIMNKMLPAAQLTKNIIRIKKFMRKKRVRKIIQHPIIHKKYCTPVVKTNKLESRLWFME